MELSISGDGDPNSRFLTACVGRRLDLNGDGSGPHPLQVIPSRWRDMKVSFEAFVDELAAVEASILYPEGTAVAKHFRQLTYDATELFDSYALLLPDRVKPIGKIEKEALSEFKRSAKRHRDFWAKLCNRFKHHGSQAKFLWGQSKVTGQRSARILISSYSGGNALLRDDSIHGGRLAGMGLVRLGQQLAHNLLRTDRAAGILIEKLAERDCQPLPNVPTALPVGNVLKRLAAMRATRHSDEALAHDGLLFGDESVFLVRIKADDLGPEVSMTASLTVEGGTSQYSVA